MTRIALIMVAVLGLIDTNTFAGKQGGLVLQFDDGWTSWATVIAPELQAVDGKATGFVNNQNLRSGRITQKDLLALQNTYQWEIGTHTWHHLNAPAYVKKNGLPAWIEKELIQSITELRALGLEIRSMVFPFNAYTPELSKAVQPLIETYRRTENLALTQSIALDKSIPGTAIDMAHYVPLELLMKWIDLAAQKDSLLLLYGHRILPDSSFVTGTVSAVSATTLRAELPVTLPEGSDWVLIPDISRRPIPPDYFHIQKTDGNVIRVDRPNLTINTKPGATFMIGEAYSTRLSDFRAFVKYASQKVNFYTLHEVASGKSKPVP
jgi:peptidoglycan/xylan/chitin deacetylase (PgdA/CDA1 family)